MGERVRVRGELNSAPCFQVKLGNKEKIGLQSILIPSENEPCLFGWHSEK
jgi:hypothetical protein